MKVQNAKKLFINKAIIGLGVVGLGLGVQACDSTDTPIDPPVTKTLTPVEEAFVGTAKNVMAVEIPEGKMLDSVYVKDEFFGQDMSWKVLPDKSTKDTIAVRIALYDGLGKSEGSGILKFFKDANGNLTSKTPGQVIKYIQDGDKTTTEINGVKKFVYNYLGADISLKQSIKDPNYVGKIYKLFSKFR